MKRTKLYAALLAAPILAIPASAASASAPSVADANAKIQALQQQLEAIQKELVELKQNQQDSAVAAVKQTEEIKNRIADTEKAQKSAVKASLTSGRPTLATADGKFTASLRGQVQADFAYYMQNNAATKVSTGKDLSSGANMRRVQLGLQGKVFGDWSYNFLYDFGGSGTEAAGKILNAYVQYDGLAPFAIRVGAFAPSFSVEDQVASGDLMFLERNTPTNMLRNVAGAEGRVGVSVIYAGPEVFGAVSYTTKKIMDANNYDAQQAVVGRLAYLVINNKEANAHLLVGVNGVHVFKLPDLNANGSTAVPMHTLSLSDYPEITVDSQGTKFLSTGAIAANHFTTYGWEIAGNYKNFYVQAAYDRIEIDRSNSYNVYSVSGTTGTTAPKVVSGVKNNEMYTWYAQASWVLTGESKTYVPATGSFASPKPTQPFSLEDGTWGAWELAGRFSETDLNSRLNDANAVRTAASTYTFYNQVRGGYEKTYTLGVNWYPNSALRVVLDYMWVDANLYGAATSSSAATLPTSTNVGQSFQAVALRTQLAF